MNLGQYFTPSWLVEEMIALMENDGTVLEPSAGSGAFSTQLECTSIELDSAFPATFNMDFMAYDRSNKFDTIIGNPPYIKFSDISNSTLSLLDISKFNKRTNLFLFFIDKCLDHLNDNGELILVVPRELATLTSAKSLNKRLVTEGSFTHWIEYGDRKIFKQASPNVVTLRWQKGLKSTNLLDGRRIAEVDGILQFPSISTANFVRLGDLATVRVGACITQATRVDGDTPVAYSKTRDTGEVLYVDMENSIFTRKVNFLKGERIYVNGRTRNLHRPFFISSVESYDGSLLGIFPNPSVDIRVLCESLNSTDWEAAGLKVGGRLVLQQRTLTNSLINYLTADAE